MGIDKFFEALGEKREEFICRGMQCSSVDELLLLAREYEKTLDTKQAAELLEFLKALQARLPDEELGKVAGGKIGSPASREDGIIEGM